MRALSDYLDTLQGRIGRGDFWFGTFVGVLATAIVGFGLMLAGVREITIDGTSVTFTLPGWAGLPLWIAASLFSLVIGLLRRHDRNNSGLDVVLFTVGSVIVGAFSYVPLFAPIYFVLQVLLLVGGIYLLVVLGFLRGTRGPNRFGPDPKEPQPQLAPNRPLS